MKLYSAPSPAPNPRRVRMAAAEKDITLEEVMLDLRRGEHKAPDHLARNPLGQVPVLELDDGTMISETVSICRYLDSVADAPVIRPDSAISRLSRIAKVSPASVPVSSTSASLRPSTMLPT